MATKTDKTLSGRPVPNEQGTITWEWQTDITVDTVVVHSLGENLALAAGAGSRLPGGGTNPYDQSSTVSSTERTARRRTLDDMRLLSEDIKRSKHTKRE